MSMIDFVMDESLQSGQILRHLATLIASSVTESRNANSVRWRCPLERDAEEVSR